MLELRHATDRVWVDLVLGDFDAFLRDHAGCERKASATAMSFVGHYPDRGELVEAMLELALEELDHFRRVYDLIKVRGVRLVPDVKDPYVAGLRSQLGRGKSTYFLDRLLISALIEARSCERLGLVAAALPEGAVKDFYRELTGCEARHHALFVDMARLYYPPPQVQARLDELLDCEGELMRRLPLRPAVH
jgi:tRNA-(ms[2]io[6]A)-hydroxylase